MKVAFLKLGGRIADEGRGIITYESVVIPRMLQLGGVSVDCFTKISKRDKEIPDLNIYEIKDHYESISGNYDALIVLNGTINFYGGAEDREQLLNLHILNNFEGPVFFIHMDSLLPLKNVWDNVKKKEWGQKYKEEDINITRDDIIYLTVFYDKDYVREITQKTGIIPKDIVYFPIEKYAFFKERLPQIGPKHTDLIYGGNKFRPKREKKLVKYYFDYPEDIDVTFFGKIKLKDFKGKLINGMATPKFEKPARYDKILEKMNESISTVNVSDRTNEGKQINLRVYEAILANVVSFIDIDFDPKKIIFENSELREFLYVKSKEEVINKIRLLKNDREFLKRILDLQYKDTYISKEELGTQFANIIKLLV